MRKSNNKRELLVGLLVAGLLIIMINYLFSNQSSSQMKYYDVLHMFETGQVSEYEVDFGSGELRMKVRKDKTKEGDQNQNQEGQNNDNSALDSLVNNNNNQDENKQSTDQNKQDNQQTNDNKNQDNNQDKTADDKTADDKTTDDKKPEDGKPVDPKDLTWPQKEVLGLVEYENQTYKIPNMTVFLQDMDRVVQKYNEANPESPIKVDYKKAVEIPWWLSVIPTVLLFGALAFMLYFMLRQSDGGAKGMNFGKVKARQVIEEKDKVTFEDVAGADEEKEELREVVEFLKQPTKFNGLGAKMPKGVLLVGPPGTGKTLLAKAVAGEAGVPFFSISGSDFVEMFVGMGAKRVRDLFEQAKTSAPCIVFIDEIDAVGRQRGAGLGGGNDEREQTLNQLLVEMDGFGTNTGVIVIAATNRRDILDPALLRPGRFDRQVYVNRPDVKGREAILKVHARNKPLGPDVDMGIIARSTAGFTGADLSNIVNEAALSAAKEGKRAIVQRHLEEAIIKVMAGPEKRSRVIPQKDKTLTAYHEAGHAITTYFCDKTDGVHEISIIPRGMAGGYTLHLPDEDKTYMSKGQMEQELVVLLGGRVAEQVILDDISTGASNDIERVTSLAKSMVKQYGFSDKVGPIVYGTSQDEVFLGRDYGTSKDYSEETAREIDEEVKKIVFVAYKEAERILTENIEKLHVVAKQLLDFEKIDGKTFDNVMKSDMTVEIGPNGVVEPSKPDVHKIVEEAQAVGQTKVDEGFVVSKEPSNEISLKKEPVKEEEPTENLFKEMPDEEKEDEE